MAIVFVDARFLAGAEAPGRRDFARGGKCPYLRCQFHVTGVIL